MRVDMAQKFKFDDYKQEVRIFRSRMSVAVVVSALLMLSLLLWMVNLQLVNHEYYSARSDGNRLHSQFVPPTRGLIYDRNGVLLADNRPVFNLTVVREQVADFDAAMDLLRRYISISEQDLEQYRVRQSRRQVPHSSVPLRLHLDDEEIAALAVNQHQLPGFAVEAQLTRHYPFSHNLAHALGYVAEINREELQAMSDEVRRNYRGTNHIGKTGVEKTYEDYLHGRVGFETVEKNNRGQVMRVLDRIDPVPGQDIQLHLDIRLQLAAEQALKDRRGAIVAIDPTTGGVLAMVSRPNFDPNLFVTGLSREQFAAFNNSRHSPLFNRALSSRVPGSTIKPFIGLAGLHHGIVTPETVINDPGFYRLPGRSRPYYNWTWWVDRTGHGPISLERAIYQSSNTYFSHIAVELGINRVHDYLRSWAFGENHSIDLPEARPGIVPSPEWKRQTRGEPWYPGETPPEGFGNGMFQATTLQMASATATIANHGRFMRPRILKALRNGESDFEAVDFGGEELPQPMLPGSDLLAEVQQAMVHTVSKPYDTQRRRHEGTAYPFIHAVRPMDYPMAGKSGTAQVVGFQVDAAGNRLGRDQMRDEHLNHAMFIAFHAAPESRIAVAVFVENGEGGSSVAGPIAREVMDAYMLPWLAEQEADSAVNAGELLTAELR
jgi:penicillin-binding protein 2